MTDEQTPPDEVLIDAAKRSGWTNGDMGTLHRYYWRKQTFRALCDMIWKYEPPVDPLVAVAESLGYFNTSAQAWANDVRAALEAQGLEIQEKGK